MPEQQMATVFLVHHSYESPEGCDETKLIGVYSSRAKAEDAVKRLSLQPGFRDRPTDFGVEEYALDQDHWTEGYVVVR